MTMTAEEVRYHGDFFRSSDPARHRLGGGGRHPPSYGRGEPSDASFERYFSTTAGRRGGTFGVEPVGRGSSEREVGTVKELSAQLREVQAKLTEKTNELDAAKARNKLMEEHIESIGADREDIVKVNLKVILWAVIFVVAVLCAVGGAAFHHEPAGKFAARALVQRWGGDGTCDGTCAVADSSRGFFSNLLSR